MIPILRLLDLDLEPIILLDDYESLYFVEKYQDIMEELWVRIANRYKYCSAVAAYDIMNQPLNNGGYTGRRAWQAGSGDAIRLTNNVYD